MRILLDTNIIPDIALGREPHFTDSANVFSKFDNKSNETPLRKQRGIT